VCVWVRVRVRVRVRVSVGAVTGISYRRRGGRRLPWRRAWFASAPSTCLPPARSTLPPHMRTAPIPAPPRSAVRVREWTGGLAREALLSDHPDATSSH
jgi:hypothetical protein